MELVRKRHLLIVLIVILVCSTIYASNTYEEVIALKKSAVVNINGTDTQLDYLEYESLMYAPISEITKKTGIEIKVNKEAETKDFIVHGLYAIESYEQYKEFYKNRSLSTFDSLSYGWSTIGDVDGQFGLVLNGANGADFYVPSGYDDALNMAKNAVEAENLMVFADKEFDRLFENQDAIIDQIVSTVNGVNSEYPMLIFDGVTIDFEFLNEGQQDEFLEFIKSLRSKLGEKKLYITVPPYKYYSYYKHQALIDNCGSNSDGTRL